MRFGDIFEAKLLNLYQKKKSKISPQKHKNYLIPANLSTYYLKIYKCLQHHNGHFTFNLQIINTRPLLMETRFVLGVVLFKLFLAPFSM